MLFLHMRPLYSKKRERAEEVEIESKSDKWIKREREREKTGSWEISRKDEYWIRAIGCFGSGTNIKRGYTCAADQ